jgi:hypothetical protein
MFVEPEPGSGFDKVAPGTLVRSLVRRFFARDKRSAGPDSQLPPQQGGAPTSQEPTS